MYKRNLSELDDYHGSHYSGCSVHLCKKEISEVIVAAISEHGTAIYFQSFSSEVLSQLESDQR